jgi:tetratricopeptide (TPR) repeat protein
VLANFTFLLRRFVLTAVGSLVLQTFCWGQGSVPIGDTVPSQVYYQGMYNIFRGEYRDAQRLLMREARTSIRIGVTQRWIDAICYHAMLGEVYYHQGQPQLALEQFDEACSMYLQYPKWMLSIEFRGQPQPDPGLARKVLPWGPSNREFTLGDVQETMLIKMGDDLARQSQVAQSGGVLRQMQFWQVNSVEIIRSLALAIRRRNELLGPLAPHDPLSRDLVNKLAGGITPPNHWSGAWADLLLGLAYAGQGNVDQAYQRLQRAERIAGQFDHPLTGVALLEQGRLAMEAGKTAAANQLFFEASISGYYYEDVMVIDEAFRLWAMNELGSLKPSPNPVLDAAAAWAQRERFDHIYARLCFTRAEELMLADNWKLAATTLQNGQAKLRDAAAGLLGNWSRYLEARVLAEMGKPNAIDTLNTALAVHYNMSTSVMQLGITNQWFDNQSLRASAAVGIYSSLLNDPDPKSWAFHPLDTLALLKAPLDASYERWIAALGERKEKVVAMEVADLAKRRRYFNALALGGRVASLRDTLESPDNTLSPGSRALRSDLLMRYPEYDNLAKEGAALQRQVRARWQPEMDKDALHEVAGLWDDLTENIAAREQIVARLSLSRLPSEFQFPPALPASDIQANLKPGQALVMFHETSNGLLGFLMTEKASTVWNCGPVGAISRDLAKFLTDVGNHDRNSSLDEKQLASTDWHESGLALFQSLFEGSSLDLTSLEELIVVPDGLVWYVPLAALPVKHVNDVVPLTSIARVRVTPTMGLAVGYAAPWRRVQHTSIVGDEIVPGEKESERTESLSNLKAAMPNLIDIPTPPPVPTPVIATALDAVVVLDEFDIERDEPLAWSPLPVGRANEKNDLGAWLNLPRNGPQRLIYAGAHTVAENGGKTSRKRSKLSPPGSELFLASCSLLSSGAQTVLLSRWKVGGQSTLEIVREFVQEIPKSTAADAWQRCIEVAKELPLEPALEPRVKLKDTTNLPTAAHPFFWAGYLLVDCGETLVEEPPADDAPTPTSDTPIPPQG